MKNVEVDIYISQVMKFFKTFPQELRLLIGDLDENNFFNEIKNMAINNYKNGNDVSLTRKQMIDIVVKMNKKVHIEDGFMITNFGEICLN
jgi:hypothetical protein